MLAVIYVRVSTEDQARRGYSLEAQEEACRKKAADLGATRVEVYRDEAVTGEILERPGLQAALAAAKDAAFFIVYDPDRLSRRLAHQLLLVEMIEKAGCRLEFVTMEWQNTPEGRLFYSLRGAIAEYEKEKFKARSRFGKIAKARRGLLTHDPKLYGYRYSEGRLEVDEAQAENYRRMVEMALNGMSPEAITMRLNAEGVPAPRGAKWYRTTVRRILRNPAYTGVLYLNRLDTEGVKAARQRGLKASWRVRPREEWIPVSIPALIEPERWEALQQALSGRKGGRGEKVNQYPLSGLLRCGFCGGPLWGHGSRYRYKADRVNRYYYCPATKGKRNIDLKTPLPDCPGGYHRAGVLEDAVWAKVSAWLKDPEALAKDAGQPEAAEAVEKEIGRIEERLRKLDQERARVFEAFRRGYVDMEVFAQAAEEIRQEKELLEARRAELEASRRAAALAAQGIDSLRSLAAEVAERLDELSWEEREKLIRLLVRQVTVKEHEILVEARITGEEFLGLETTTCGAVPSMSAIPTAGITTPSKEPLSEEQQRNSTS